MANKGKYRIDSNNSDPLRIPLRPAYTLTTKTITHDIACPRFANSKASTIVWSARPSKLELEFSARRGYVLIASQIKHDSYLRSYFTIA